MRLFVAIPLPAHVRQTLTSIQGGVHGARWVEGDNLHLTVCFIGEVEGAGLGDIDSELSGVSFPAFDVGLSGLGVFERGQRIHMIWAGFDSVSTETLTQLHERVEAAVKRAGHEPDRRKYKPHVTLARFKNAQAREVGAYMEANNIHADGGFRVEGFNLYRSHLGHGGATYEIIYRYPLTDIAV